MKKQELLKRIEELEKAVAELRQMISNIESEPVLPTQIYQHRADDEIPCYAREDITIAKASY